MTIPASEWRWFGDAGHFICARWCQFHLCTKVGEYLVSTVGRLWLERSSREIHAKVHDPEWFAANQMRRGDDFDHAYMKRFGYDNVGYERKFESMVFLAGKPCDAPECHCGLPEISGSELDFAGYNDAKSATEGHYALCEKAARGEIGREECAT